MSDQVLDLTREEVVRRLEEGARRRLGLSAAELLRQYRAGALPDPCALADLLVLADLLEDDDPLFGAAA